MNHPEDCLTLKQSIDMKTILLFLLLCISVSTSAQTVDERAGIYMNQTDWFSLQREFAINKDSLHPFLQEFSQALLDNLFNRPEAAPVNP